VIETVAVINVTGSCKCFSLSHDLCNAKHLTAIKSFIYPTNAQLDCSKRMLKFTLIFTLKVLLHVWV